MNGKVGFAQKTDSDWSLQGRRSNTFSLNFDLEDLQPTDQPINRATGASRHPWPLQGTAGRWTMRILSPRRPTQRAEMGARSQSLGCQPPNERHGY